MNIDRALEVVDKARTEAERAGVDLAIAVVDAGGSLLAFARMDGASFLLPDAAIGKAYAAVGTKKPTHVLAQALSGTDAVTVMAASSGGRVLVAPGGAPIKEGDEVVGAVGVSGGPGDQDARIAEAAAAV